MKRRINHLACTVLVFALALGAGVPRVSLATDEELLPPELAFVMDAKLEGDRIVTRWQVAEGYYLYRERFGFESESIYVGLSPPSIPDGVPKYDEFFGEMQTLRGEFEITIPFTGVADTSEPLELQVTSQGCADIGVCYPPLIRTLSLHMPRDPSGGGGASAAFALFATSNDEFLDPRIAFRLQATEETGTRGLRWDIAPGYYLYRDKLIFRLTEPRDGLLIPPQLPTGEVKHDEYFGETVVYYQRLDVPIRLAGDDAKPVELEVVYQGCAEAGLCYPPITQRVSFTEPTGVANATGYVTGQAAPMPAGETSAQDRIAQTLVDGQFAWIALTFFGFGLLLAFTPCVLPMVPILSGLIIGQGNQATTARAFVISLVYVLAMALTYTTAGVAAGLFGGGLQAAFQNVWVLSLFSLVFVCLAGAMFGFYQLQIPPSWQTTLSILTNRQTGGTLTGAAVMGLLSALIVGPCVAAPLAGALIYIGQTGDAVLGGLALFFLSLGMGAPLLVVGTSAGRFLPRAGAWMSQIKALFGFILLGVAIYLISRVLPDPVTLALWAALIGAGAVFVGGLRGLAPSASRWAQARKAFGLVLFVYAATLVVGAMTGSDDPLRPLARIGLGERHGLVFTRVKDVETLTSRLAGARSEGRAVMLDYYADWCVSCKEMERDTFTDPAVQQVLADTVLLQADVTANNDDDKALLTRYGLFGPPAILFFGADGSERSAYRVVGFLGPQAFSAHAEKAQH